MNKDWFVIKNIKEFTDKTRAIVYNNFGKWESESSLDQIIDSIKDSDRSDIDKVLSYQESLIIIKQIAKKQRNKKTNKNRLILNEELFTQIVLDLNSRMISNILNELVRKGLVESAFDTESNDFIFWVKDEDKKSFEKPETD
jgi:hypothetical protein